MSYINWGNESPKQRAARAKAETEALYEQAARIRMQSQGGVGGGSKAVPGGGSSGKPTAIHFPASSDKVFPMFGFPRGAKMRTDIRNHALAYGEDAPSIPPGYQPAKSSYGVVYGESSISTLSAKPQVISGVEHKFNLNFGTEFDGDAFIRSLFVASEGVELEMEYLYHQGQEVVTQFPKVHFDGSYVTVDALTTDIVEDTHVWYVLRNIGGSGVDLSFQIFVTDIEVNWTGESTVDSIFSGTSLERTTVTTKFDAYYQKIQEWMDLMKESPLNGTAISNKHNEISISLGELSTAIGTWKDNNTVDDGSGNQVNTVNTFYSILQEYEQSVFQQYQAIASDFETYSCLWKDSTNGGGGITFPCGNVDDNISGYAHSNTAYLGYTKDNEYFYQSMFNMMRVTQSAFGTSDCLTAIKSFEDFYLEKTDELFFDAMNKLDIKFKTVKKLKGLVQNFVEKYTIPDGDMFNISDYFINL